MNLTKKYINNDLEILNLSKEEIITLREDLKKDKENIIEKLTNNIYTQYDVDNILSNSNVSPMVSLAITGIYGAGIAFGIGGAIGLGAQAAYIVAKYLRERFKKNSTKSCIKSLCKEKAECTYNQLLLQLDFFEKNYENIDKLYENIDDKVIKKEEKIYARKYKVPQNCACTGELRNLIKAYINNELNIDALNETQLSFLDLVLKSNSAAINDSIKEHYDVPLFPFNSNSPISGWYHLITPLTIITAFGIFGYGTSISLLAFILTYIGCESLIETSYFLEKKMNKYKYEKNNEEANKISKKLYKPIEKKLSNIKELISKKEIKKSESNDKKKGHNYEYTFNGESRTMPELNNSNNKTK